jgi:Short C-terminal domain
MCVSADASDPTPPVSSERPAATHAEPPERRRRGLPLVLIAVASLLAFVAIFAVWANRQLLNTENWTETSSELLENDAIRTEVANLLVAELYANVDVERDLEQGLRELLRPRGARALAGPAASGLRTLAEDLAKELLGRPRAQQLWEEANRRAHARFLDVVEGGGDVVSTTGGDVTLDLKALLGQTQSNLGVGGRVQEKLPQDAAQIVILRSDQLELGQDLVRLLKALAIGLVVAFLGLFALAVYLARGWRREALRACGVGLLFAGAAALVARALAGDAVVDALATTESVRPAVEATWSIGTSLLVQVASATLVYGVVIVVAAWLAGPTTWAVAARRELAPYLREPRFAWGAFGLLVLVLLAWAPTPAFRQPVTALILIGLLSLGVEALRRQTAREHPDASREHSFRRMRAWASGIGARATGAGTPSSPTAVASVSAPTSEDRLQQLERLIELRDAGVLDASEFEREKQRILATPAAAGG